MKHKYFSYCPEDGFDTHETLEDALLNANDIIPNYLDEGWSEDVTGVFVGTITHAATMCDKVERAGEVDEHGYDEDGEHWDPDWEYKCNYKMLPVKKQSPAHDAAVYEVEQEPYAYEYGRDNGDGTFSVVMNKGMITQLGENEYGYCHPGIFASKEWPVTPLYLHPQPAPDVSMLAGVLEKCREIINPPKQNCSCHISPPCADCVAYGFERELADEIDAALAAYRQQGG